MDEHKRRNLLKLIRTKLDEYGAKDTESIGQALDRLIAEHKAAVETAATTKVINNKIQAEIDLAKRGRTLTQESSNGIVKLAREFEADSIRMRKALDILLKCFPVETSQKLNDWIAQDKAQWEKASS
jgi:phage tail tape-measure protein